MKHLHYLFLLDCSGSMEALRRQTFDSINEQINTIKETSNKEGLKTFFSLMTFDTNRMDYIYRNWPAEQIRAISWEDFVPNGGTPLYDAIGKSVTELQKSLGARIQDDFRNVLVTIFTDGEENSSHNFNHSQISKMIEFLSEDGKFVFAFVGAGNLKTVQDFAKTLNIKAGNVTAYTNDAEGNKTAFQNLKVCTTSYMTAYSAGEEVSDDFFAVEKT